MWVAANRSDANMSNVPANRLTATAIRKAKLDCGGEFFNWDSALDVVAWQDAWQPPEKLRLPDICCDAAVHA
jgi:hypothetical protein